MHPSTPTLTLTLTLTSCPVHKWNEKKFHYSRYYMLGVHLAIIDHEENVERDVRHILWKQGCSLRHKGRFYQKTTRERTTCVWRDELWDDYEVSMYPQAELSAQPSYLVDMEGVAEARRRVIQPSVPTAATAEAQEAEDAAAAERRSAAASSVDAEAAAQVAASASSATAAACMLQRLGPAAEEETRIALAVLTSEAIAEMKVDALKAQLKIFGLDIQGKKQVLADRLQELLDSQAAPMDLGNGEDPFDTEGGSGDGAGVHATDGPVTALSPVAACALMGVPVEWFEVKCSHCQALLFTRLPTPITPVVCRACNRTLAIRNCEAPQPKFPERGPGRGPRPEQRQFMSLELARLKAQDDALPQSERRTQRQRMAEAAHSFHAQPKPTAAAPAPAVPAAASPPVPSVPPEWQKYVGTYTTVLEGTPHESTGQPWTAAECAALSEHLLPLYQQMPQPTVVVASRPISAYNADLGVVVAAPATGEQPLRKRGIAVLGMQGEPRAAVPPPFVRMPIAERPKKAKHERHIKRKMEAEGNTGGVRRVQRMRPVDAE